MEALERALAFPSDYAEENAWPSVEDITTGHIVAYLASLQNQQCWFGEMGGGRPLSQSYITSFWYVLSRS